jgi:hypothetical protein
MDNIWKPQRLGDFKYDIASRFKVRLSKRLHQGIPKRIYSMINSLTITFSTLQPERRRRYSCTIPLFRRESSRIFFALGALSNASDGVVALNIINRSRCGGPSAER